jgi:hypothetical protein
MNLLIETYAQRIVSRPCIRYSHELQKLRDLCRLKMVEGGSEPKRAPPVGDRQDSALWADLIKMNPRAALRTSRNSALSSRPQPDALDSFELADCLLDAGATFVKNFRKQ